MSSVSSENKHKGVSKQTTERLPYIDIRQLRKKGYLQPYTDGYLTWSVAGETICRISYRMYSKSMSLDYKHRPKNSDWVQVQQDISFDKTKCNYGGSRPWFLCPDCGKRIAVIYYQNGRFSCRHCHQLTYASQQENEEARMRRKSRKIRQRLGASDSLFEPIWDKPKGMHQTTFKKLCREANDAHSLSWTISDERFSKHS